MASYQATMLFMLLASSISLANAVENVFHHGHNDVFLRGLPANASTNVTLLSAPYYRNVSVGAAWVVPSSAYDLGARDMSCECFDPSETCCMAKSNNIAPFCIPKSSTCCSDAFCNPGETCCGDSCCPMDTTCNIKTIGSGCCPKGQICSSPPICYDHSSPNCTNTFFPAQQCCPPNIPFCRDFQPNGLGCYAMSSLPAASTTVGFASPGTGMTTTWSSTTTITETVTVNPEGPGSVSLAFPATAVTGPPFPVVVTSTRFVSSSAASPSLGTQNPSTETPPPPNPSKSSSTAPSMPSSPHPSSTSTSALCFNPTLQSAAPCTPSTTPTTPSAASSGFAPAGASTFNSQATSLLPPPLSLDHLRNYAALLTLSLIIATSSILLLASEKDRQVKLSIDKSAIQIVHGSARKLRGELGREIQVVEGSGRVLRGSLEKEILVVEGSGRVLRGDLGREIKVVEETGRVWKEPFAVDKSHIHVIEGSARILPSLKKM